MAGCTTSSTLRWRWDDPWQGHIITHARTSSDVGRKHTERSEDLFEQRGLFFRDEELAQAKAVAQDFP